LGKHTQNELQTTTLHVAAAVMVMVQEGFNRWVPVQ